MYNKKQLLHTKVYEPFIKPPTLAVEEEVSLQVESKIEPKAE